MKTASEIRNAVTNIQYYAKQIEESGRKQMNEDVRARQELGVNVNAGTVRFDCLGAIGAASNWIESHCLNILSNLEQAEKQDKLLNREEKEYNA